MIERPVSVLLFGILNIVWGVLQVLGVAVGLVFRLQLLDLPTSGNPAVELMESNVGYRWFSDISTGIALIAAIGHLSAGVGLIVMKPWARTVTIGLGVYTMIMTLLVTVINHVLITAPMLEQTTQGPQRLGAVAGAVAGWGWLAVVTVFCLLMIYFMTRPRVVAAFQEDATPWDRESATSASQPEET